MISFRLTKQRFVKNSFIARRTTSISKTLNQFGYIKYITDRGVAIVDWYSNYTKVELEFSLEELKRDCKSIYPYFNNKFVRGGIWKYSYSTLLNKINRDIGFTKIMVDKITYRKTPTRGNKVMICDAQYVLKNNIKLLDGKIVRIEKKNFHIKTAEGVFQMTRCHFKLVPQDYFNVLSIRN